MPRHVAIYFRDGGLSLNPVAPVIVRNASSAVAFVIEFVRVGQE